jgi:aminoglycoside phosphotransferase family enzyme/predicted kinase
MHNAHADALPPVIEAMTHPEFYPDSPPAVELKQTHISWVFLAGGHVYKIKKPVRFDFLDASALRSRLLLCRDEVRLNRRLAPDTYLAVVPIVDRGHRYIFGEPGRVYGSELKEYAVKMRRLPEHRMLDHLLREGKLPLGAMDALAKKLAAFHYHASSAEGWRYGSVTAVQRVVMGNLEECGQCVGRTVDRHAYNLIREYLSGFVTAHRELLSDRAREGRVREGHGDLRCEHVCMTDAIDIFDCVEFSLLLRCCDVACDLAFLAMDLDSLDAPHLADELVTAYAKAAGDERLATLINFYKCYRACVRGKVNSLKSLEREIPQEEHRIAREHAREKFALASRYAARGRPSLLVVCGLSGTGKSTIAATLRNRTGFEILNSDVVRKRLAGVPERDHTKFDYGAGIYGASFDQMTYHALTSDARRCLREGRGVILDATFRSREHRHAALELGKQCGVPVLFVECRLEEAEALRRLRDRAAEGSDVSDATVDVYQLQKRDFAPINELPHRQHLIVDMLEDREMALQRIEHVQAGLFETLDLREYGENLAPVEK